jgi:hypothetical protein
VYIAHTIAHSAIRPGPVSAGVSARDVVGSVGRPFPAADARRSHACMRRRTTTTSGRISRPSPRRRSGANLPRASKRASHAAHGLPFRRDFGAVLEAHAMF